jgi:hypothetical protein
MATRVRKPGLPTAASAESMTDPAVVAPVRRRVATSRTTTTRTTASSSRTHRPIPAGELTAAVPSSASAQLLVAAPVAAAASSTAPLPSGGLAVPSVTEPAESVPASVAVDPGTVAAAAPKSEKRKSAAEARAAVPGAAPKSTAKILGDSESLPADLGRLQLEVKQLHQLLRDQAESSAQNTAKVSQQTVRMITGVAHHLDRLAEQVTEVTSAARSLASAVLRIESSMALLQERTRIQQESFDRTHRELEAVWGPLVQQLTASQTRRSQEAGVENVERYRLGVELQQLRQTIAAQNTTASVPAAAAAVVGRAVRTIRGGR